MKPMKETIVYIRLIVAICSFWLCGGGLYGNEVHSISNIDGLSNNSVNCIIEDSDHTVWIGTWDGLNVYDGRNVSSFRYSKSNPNSISNNVIRQVVEQGENLWVATDNGINRVDRKSHRVTRYYLDNGIPTQEQAFLLAKLPSGGICCWVKGRGIFRYHLQEDAFVLSELVKGNDIVDFKIDGSGNVLLLAADGTVRKTREPELFHDGKFYELDGWKGVKVNKILDLGKSIAFVTADSLHLLDSHLKQVGAVALKSKYKVASAMRKDTHLYVGFVGGGCVCYDLKTGQSVRLNGVSAQISVMSIYQGSQDIIWMGTDGKGVVQLFPFRSSFHTLEIANPVRCFCQDNQGNMLVGTKGSGIKRLNRQTFGLSDFLDEQDGLGAMSVYAMKKNASGDIFIGTEGGGIDILYQNGKGVSKLDIPEQYPYFQSVYSICFTNHDSLLWVGTSGYGLIKMNLVRQSGKYKVTGLKQYISSASDAPLNNDIVYAVAPDHSGKYVWFGTRGGGISRVSVFRNEVQSVEDIYPHIQLTNNDVLSILADKEVLWVGTSYGLNKLVLKDGGSVVQYADQLADRTIHSLLKDRSGNIWMGTNHGLLHLDTKTEHVENYTFADGLHNDELADGAAFATENNRLFFGGVNGFSFFHADSIHLRQFEPVLVLSDLKILNLSQDIGERIVNGKLKLGYDERTFTLTFLTKEFIKNANCEYAYRFRNNSSDWIYLGNNPKISFAQLPPGEFLLEVKSTNGDKVWSDYVYQLVIQVAYPWWFSVPAIITYIIIVLIVCYVSKRIIVGRIRMSRQVLIARVEAAHEQKMYEAKLNFFMNVAHEFFTPLTLIYTPVQYLLEQKDLKANSRKYLNLIKSNAERMQKLIGELMEFRKAGEGNVSLYSEQIDLNDFLRVVADNYVDILKENKIAFEIEVLPGETTFSTDRNSLEKIVFNLLSNAFKYTPRNGYIRVKAELQQEGVLCFKIRNSGKGLTSEQMTEIFDRYKIFDTPNVDGSVSNGIGLNLTKQLVEILHGNIQVDSVLGEFVEFTVVLPSLPPASSLVLSEDASEKSFSGSPDEESKSQATVLLVENDEEIAKLLKDILKDYEVKEVSNGKEALAYIEETHPDIILTDRMMEEMDGLTLTRKLKSDIKTSYIPIVMISGKGAVEDQIEACKSGVDAYVVKPFHPLQVISVVGNLISRQHLLKDYFNSSLSIIRKKEGYELHPEDEKMINAVSDIIVEHIDDETLSSGLIAEKLGMSKATLYRKFKGAIDKTPNEFIRGFRLDYAAKLLRTTQLTVMEVMYKSGFSNKSYFYREFQKQYGFSPKDYRTKEQKSLGPEPEES